MATQPTAPPEVSSFTGYPSRLSAPDPAAYQSAVEAADAEVVPFKNEINASVQNAYSNSLATYNNALEAADDADAASVSEANAAASAASALDSKNAAELAVGSIPAGTIINGPTSDTDKTWSGTYLTTQFASIAEKATFTATMAAGQQNSYTLPVPVQSPLVAIYKEVPQTGVTNDNWDVNVGGGDYDIEAGMVEDGGSIKLTPELLTYTGLSVSTTEPGVAEGSASGIFLSNDGLTMFFAGLGTDKVYQYSLSSPFDFTVAPVYTGLSFSVLGQTGAVNGLTFSANGLDMFIVDTTNDTVYQYSLSNPFDFTVAPTYTGLSFSVASETGQPEALTFSTDGLTMFVAGLGAPGGGSRVYQYSLSNPFDFTVTPTYTGLSFDTSTQETQMRGVRFSSDGLKMYVVGTATDTVYLYSLSGAFDFTSPPVYTGASFSVAAQDSAPHGLFVNQDETAMFIIGQTNDRIYQYDVTQSVAMTSAYYSAITNAAGKIDTRYWLDINSMTADETLNSQTIYYSFSTDGKTTFKVSSAAGDRNIARDNLGTWEYNSNATYGSETWTAAAVNSVNGALADAMTVTQNRMTGADLAALLDAEMPSLGDSLDLAVTMLTNSSAQTPSFSGMAINYDAAILNKLAINGTDYEVDAPTSTEVRVKALVDGNFKGRIL